MEFSVRIVGGNLGLKAVYDNLRDFKAYIRATFPALLDDPNSYTRPDRFVGGPALPHEPIPSWDPGYNKAKARLHVRKRSVSVSTTRPYFPVFTDRVNERWIEGSARFVVEDGYDPANDPALEDR